LRESEADHWQRPDANLAIANGSAILGDAGQTITLLAGT